jgi:uncharacterized protein (DUF1015 family)
MAEIRPYRAVYYNESLVGELSDVICPPYDIISPQMEQELYDRSPYNFVRIENNRQLPQDSATDNRYTRSASIMQKWLEDGVLVTDWKAAIYIHDHYFNCNGRKYMRRGLSLRVRLEDWHRNIVRPHEGTLSGARSDRISLLGALKANTSPIMSMYEDKERRIASLLDKPGVGESLFSLDGEDGERHEVWCVTRPEAISEICAAFRNKPLYIADGHHRYESALTYQRERLATNPQATAEEGFNFVMMTLVDIDAPGLVILPPHRLLRGLPPSKLSGLAEKLDSFFDITSVSLNQSDAWQKIDAMLSDKSRIKLVLFGLDGDKLQVLALRDEAAAGNMMPYFHSDIYKRLDVSVVDHVILEELLGLGGEEEIKISYDYDRQKAVDSVLAQEHQLAFIVSPVKGKTIKDIADAGDRMRRKSPYFYPKLPSGLLINQL